MAIDFRFSPRPVPTFDLAPQGGYKPMDLASLGQQLFAGQEAGQKRALEGQRRQTLAELGQMGTLDPQRMGVELLKLGDLQGAMTAAQLAQSQSDREFQRGIQTRQLTLQEQQANRPQIIGGADTGYYAVPPAGSGGAATQVVAPRVKPKELSSTDKKAIFEAEDALPQLQNTLSTLGRAAELNNKTYTGATAPLAATIGTSGIPGAGYIVDTQKAKDTAEFGQIMSQEALTAMASTLKGATTDQEMNRYLSLIADPKTPPETRARVIGRLQSLAERQKQIAEARLRDLRAGTYFGQGGGQDAAGAALVSGRPGVAVAETEADTQRLEAGMMGGSAPAAPRGNFVPSIAEIPEGKRFRAPDGKIYRKVNGKPVLEGN